MLMLKSNSPAPQSQTDESVWLKFDQLEKLITTTKKDIDNKISKEVKWLRTDIDKKNSSRGDHS